MDEVHEGEDLGDDEEGVQSSAHPPTEGGGEFNELDMQIAILRGLGYTVEQTAEKVGFSKRHVYNRLKKNGDFIVRWSGFADGHLQMNKLQFEQALSTNVMDIIESMLPDVARNIKQSLNSMDPALRYKAALDMLHQVKGTPTKTVRMEGSQPGAPVVHKVDVFIINKIHRAIGAPEIEVPGLPPAATPAFSTKPILEGELVGAG